MDQAEQLRNVVKQINQNNTKTARVITVTSGKGGVGKSNVSVNLAVQLKKAGRNHNFQQSKNFQKIVDRGM